MKWNILALGAGLALAAGTITVAVAGDEAPGQRTEERVVVVTGGPGGDHHAGMDANNDGSISRDEFRAQHDKMFAKMDKNGDGKLSEDEFRRHHGPGENIVVRVDGPHGPGGHGPGHGSGMEWSERRGPGGPNEDVRIVRRGPGEPDEMDKNKDGKISFDEMSSPLREHFQEADKNKDGFLDKDEMGGDHVFMFRRVEKAE